MSEAGPTRSKLSRAEFPAGVRPMLTVTSRIATKNCAVNFSAPQGAESEPCEIGTFSAADEASADGGIVKATATEITSGAKTEVEKSAAIYEWIVDNTFEIRKRAAAPRGYPLHAGVQDLGGKCADLNALFVGLARAAGLPARDVYGIRVAKSRWDTRASALPRRS